MANVPRVTPRAAGENAMWRRKRIRVLGLAIIIAASCLYQGACLSALYGVNPCGTVLANCDPAQYEQLFGDYYEPGFDVDPTCIIPFACDDG